MRKEDMEEKSEEMKIERVMRPEIARGRKAGETK